MLAALLTLAAVLHVNTESVLAVVEREGVVVVTTSGGIERYDALTLERLGVEPAAPPAAGALPVAPRYQGARETVRVTTSAGVLVGTAGAGLWLDGAAPRRLTPTGQICGNHIVALASFQGALWAGAFDAGVCRLDGERWTAPAVPFRLVNDLAVTPAGLVVAAAEGLFVSTDGMSFTAWPGVSDRGWNDLAFADGALWATAPGSLWRLPLDGGKPHRVWRPGGARALQAVAGGGGELWLASEDVGAVRVVGDGYELADRAAGLPTSWIIDLAVADGVVWLASFRDGLLRRCAAGFVPVRGLESAWLLTVGPDGAGGVWVGAQRGLYHVDAAGRVRAHTRLPEPNVHAVLVAGERLWVATERGLLDALPAELAVADL